MTTHHDVDGFEATTEVVEAGPRELSIEAVRVAVASWEANPGDGALHATALAALDAYAAVSREGLTQRLTDHNIAELRRELAAAAPLPTAATFRPVTTINDALPPAHLQAADMAGAVLSEGTVCLLSGAGGVAKSTLALTVALDVAYGAAVQDDGRLGRGLSGLFGVRSGPVVVASFEDPPAVVRIRLERLGRGLNVVAAPALHRVHVGSVAGLPLWGPPPEIGTYAARPVQLRGWGHLWDAVARVKPALVVIDPALDAYVGEPNNPAAVREFVSALGAAAREHHTAVLLLAHSNKAVRTGGQRTAKDDPYDAGQVGGTSAWADAARGVLTLTRRAGGRRILAVAKANWGRAFVQVELQEVTDGGDLAGFKAAVGGWMAREEAEDDDTQAAPPKPKRPPKAKEGGYDATT